VQGLERIARSIDGLVAEAPARAADLFETFLAGCYQKSEEIDDSSGGFGELMQQLCCRWVRARQAAGSSAGETVGTLLRWRERDGYGYTYELEGKLVEVLDQAGLAALAREAKVRFDEAGKEAKRRAGEVGGDAARREWARVLKAVHRARKDTLSYIRLCRELGMTAEDCVVLADLFDAHGESQQALSWIRRGLEISGSRSGRDYQLRTREKTLLKKVGRPEEALTLAWKDFNTSPSSVAYEELMACAPEAERKDWHLRALERARTADLSSAVDLFLEVRETDRLLGVLEGAKEPAVRALGHYTLQKAAKLLEKDHPAVAARLYRSLGLRIVDEAKSKYYRFALSHLARAKRCYEKAGLAKEWEAMVKDVRKRHHRKPSFIPGFEKVVKGLLSKRSSFLDRARKRWAGPPQG
jgi:uncharacterized Zn finger protein